MAVQISVRQELSKLMLEIPFDLYAALYADDHPKVLAFLKQCSSGRSCKATEQDELRKLQTGEGWSACFRRVEEVRAYLEKKFGKPVYDLALLIRSPLMSESLTV